MRFDAISMQCGAPVKQMAASGTAINANTLPPLAQLQEVEVDQRLSRLVPSRFPTVGVFDELADTEAELRILFNLEMLTNERLNAPIGRLELLPEGSLVTGRGAHQIMAAWVHCHDDGGRFNDGRLGAWYASLNVATAIDETVFHLTKRLSKSEGGFPQQIQMRELRTHVQAPLVDLTGLQTTYPELYHHSDYAGSQRFANNYRWPFAETGINGLRYNSVRSEGGINVCVFKPQLLSQPIIEGSHYQYEWSANGEVFIDKMTPLKR